MQKLRISMLTFLRSIGIFVTLSINMPCQKNHNNNNKDMNRGGQHTQVSDVPQRVQFCVFFIKCDEHRRSSHASRHGTAVDVVPGGDRWIDG